MLNDVILNHHHYYKTGDNAKRNSVQGYFPQHTYNTKVTLANIQGQRINYKERERENKSVQKKAIDGMNSQIQVNLIHSVSSDTVFHNTKKE